jgi:hypothetical protein
VLGRLEVRSVSGAPHHEPCDDARDRVVDDGRDAPVDRDLGLRIVEREQAVERPGQPARGVERRPDDLVAAVRSDDDQRDPEDQDGGDDGADQQRQAGDRGAGLELSRPLES